MRDVHRLKFGIFWVGAPPPKSIRSGLARTIEWYRAVGIMKLEDQERFPKKTAGPKTGGIRAAFLK